MKLILPKLIKFKAIVLSLLILQSCFGENNEIDLLEIDRFDQLQILRDGTKIDTFHVDSFKITIDTIVSKDEDCKKLKSI